VENHKVIRNEPFPSILLFGPPGSGKGTLGDLLHKIGGHIHVSSGEIFRSFDANSSMGALYRSYAHKGELVPDEVTVDMWRTYVQELIQSNQYSPHRQLLLLDGIPRTQKQVEMIAPYIQLKKILVLQVANVEVLMQRIRRRSSLEKRQDDVDEKVLRNRMAVYEKQTRSLLELYPRDQIAFVHADQKPLEVLRDVLVSISSILSYPA